MSTNERTRFPLLPVEDSPYWDFHGDVPGTIGIETSLFHNVFIRCLNSIYYHAPRVKEGDEIAFAGYCLAFTEIIRDRLRSEEDIIFPFLQTKFDLPRNDELQGTLMKGIDVFEEYMTNVWNSRESLNGEEVRQYVESFGDTLVKHLHDEIPMLAPERMVQYDQEKLLAMVLKNADRVKALPFFRSYPLVITHHDFKAGPSWPPMPPPVLWFIKNVAYWRHQSYWQFSPFTRYGNRWSTAENH